jgi:glycosyltransferase involved in cell wall biosynthesis
MTKRRPEVSFILAVRNGDRFLANCIRSVIEQSFENWELIIVVNCSEDKSFLIAQKYREKDNRISVMESKIGQLNYNLNLALDASVGQYIARIDADDINFGDRLSIQVPLMKKFDIVGSNAVFIDENDIEVGKSSMPKYNKSIRRKIFYRSVVLHPTVLIKKSLLMENGGYQGGRFSEDYDLWLLLMRNKNICFHNVQKPLVKYRLHGEQMSSHKDSFAYVASYFIREALLRRSLLHLVGGLIYIVKYAFK